MGETEVHVEAKPTPTGLTTPRQLSALALPHEVHQRYPHFAPWGFVWRNDVEVATDVVTTRLNLDVVNE